MSWTWGARLRRRGHRSAPVVRLGRGDAPTLAMDRRSDGTVSDQCAEAPVSEVVELLQGTAQRSIRSSNQLQPNWPRPPGRLDSDQRG